MPTGGWSVKHCWQNKERFKKNSMITILENPQLFDDNSVNPVSGCLKWKLQPDNADVATTPGSAATIVVEFPISPTVPADGTEFIIWGHTFTVDSATDFTSSSFKVTTNGFQTALYFKSMLEANIFFRRATLVELSGAFDNTATITWRECREQSAFGGTSMDIAGLESTGATVTITNGVSPVYVDGYKTIVRLLRLESSGIQYTEMTRLEGIEPARTCAGAGPVSIDFMADARRSLYPRLPELSATSYIAPASAGTFTKYHSTGFFAVFQLEYGWVFRQDCQPKSGTLMKSGKVWVVNMAFPVEDIYNVRRYWPDHPDGLPPGQTHIDFLTTIPKKSRVCSDSFLWLWFVNSFASGSSSFTIKFVVTTTSNTVVTYNFTMPHPGETLQNFNASPAFLATHFSIDLSTVKQYTVHAEGFAGSPFVATSELTFVLESDCCGTHTDGYFLTPAGGIGTIIFEENEFETIQNGDEICVDVPCGVDPVFAAKHGGRTLGTLRAYDQKTFTAKEPYTEQNQRWFADFKRSPHRWIRVNVTGVSGEYIAKKFIPETGGVRVFRDGENLELSVTGYFADIPLQSVTEPIS